MNILFCASEATPIIKVGGLGDVAGSLPGALYDFGVDIRLALPSYSSVKAKYTDLNAIKHSEFEVVIKDDIYKVIVYTIKLPGTDVLVYLFENDDYISEGDHKAIYGGTDGLKRFIFFNKALQVFIKKINQEWSPDLLHLNDWHMSLIPSLISEDGVDMPKSLLTIHNLPYQNFIKPSLLNSFDIETNKYEILKMARRWFFSPKRISILREGIRYADYLSTVSPSYANEILTPEFGAGMHSLLNDKKDKLFGILNGVDYKYWNPESDDLIYSKYGKDTFIEGKKVNKRDLLNEIAPTLMNSDNIPLISFIGRIDAGQKGIDILYSAIEDLIGRNTAKILMLGTGDKTWEKKLSKLSKNNADKFVYICRFDESLAHKIYAASDIMIIPSKYEPCGLIQMISMRYATVPIVRRTGGLKDSVDDGINGYIFNEYSAYSLINKINEAINSYSDKNKWIKLSKNAIEKDFSWNVSAKKYLELYNKILSK